MDKNQKNLKELLHKILCRVYDEGFYASIYEYQRSTLVPINKTALIEETSEFILKHCKTTDKYLELENLLNEK